MFTHSKQDKLDAKVINCVFISCVERLNGCKLWEKNLERAKIIIRMDVNFDETNMRGNNMEVEE